MKRNRGGRAHQAALAGAKIGRQDFASSCRALVRGEFKYELSCFGKACLAAMNLNSFL